MGLQQALQLPVAALLSLQSCLQQQTASPIELSLSTHSMACRFDIRQATLHAC